MRALSGLLRRQHRDVARATREYAAQAAVIPAEESPFLRFANPVPQIYTHESILGEVPETKVTTLPNGLRVATEQQSLAKTATVGVWIDAGSRYESDKTNGAAHFLEHMFFKGTKNRSAKQLETEIEDMGGHLNAYTSREQTCYYTKIMQSNVPQAVDILADILQHSNLTDEAIARERQVILREMSEIENIPDEVVLDHLHATAFQNTPLGRTILGPAENIQSINRQMLSDYIANHYTAPRMVLAGAGAVDHDELVDMAKSAFADLPSEGVSTADLIKQEPSEFTGSEVRIRDPDSELVNMTVAFKGASYTDADSIPLMVMQAILGSWDKHASAGGHFMSTLAQRVATNQLCDRYTAFNTNYSDAGLWGVSAVADKHVDLDDLAWCIMQAIGSLSYNVSEDDVIRARNQLKANLLFSQDTTTGVCEEIGRHLLTYGRRMPKAELFARIDAVTPEVVRAVADRFIYDQDIAIAAMGETCYLPDYTWFRRRTYWLRY
ncbi:hypothetical protein WJX84_008185 [Apatococcus fuscideae]|uniref:mitochondrial processing peptidase n=1 Tax=Apatococcus fuscideae TaxID=2026836 RepID=A0AAW1TEA3_9CHLO